MELSGGLFNRIGFNFKRDGIIDKPEDIYFLHINEIFELIEGRSVNNSITKNIIALRKNRNSRYLAMETPERMYFWGDICNTELC